MNQYAPSRRDFLQQSAALASTSWARLVLPSIAALSQAACSAKEDKAPFTILGDAEAVEFEAIAARIIPTTDTPGAREAGVIYFFDQTLGTFNKPMAPMLRGGLEEFQAGIEGGKKFSTMSDAEQDAYLEANQDSPFFGVMRLMTFSGFFGMRKYGGNKDGTGWQLLGMDPNVHAYEAPFGYYDAEYMKEHPNG